MTHYVKFWRLNAIDDSERLLLKLNGTAINSEDLSRMMNQRFSAAARKSFVFTSFRQVVQTVFAHFETDPNKKRWFNKMLQHADSTGEKYYETAELIRLGQYPTYSEVSESFHQLSKTVMSDDFWKQVIALINSTVQI